MAPLRELIAGIVREEVERALSGRSAEYLSTAEAASLARVAPDTLRRWVKGGRIEALGAGRELRFRRADLDALLARGRRRRATREETVEERARRAWAPKKSA